jgi:hypothetical protein
MQKTTKVTRNIPVDYTKYTNTETGETMDSEMKGKTTITAKEGTDLFTINSDDYVVFDSGAIQYLINNLNKPDVATVFTMSKMVIGDCSVICTDNKQPHTPDTLSLVLDMNKNKFYELVRRLMKKGILAYTVCAPSGYVQKIYMLNPYIARKRKTINCELSFFFKDITQ